MAYSIKNRCKFKFQDGVRIGDGDRGLVNWLAHAQQRDRKQPSSAMYPKFHHHLAQHILANP